MRDKMKPKKKPKKAKRVHAIDEIWARTFRTTNRNVALFASKLSFQQLSDFKKLVGVDGYRILQDVLMQISGQKNPEENLISMDIPTLNQLEESIQTELRALAFNINQPIDCILSFDGTSFNAQTIITSHGNVKGVTKTQSDQFKAGKLDKSELKPLQSLYALIVTPVDPQYPSFTVHCHFAVTPQFTDNIYTLVMDCVQALQTNKINIIGMSFDGEPNQKQAFTNQFFNYLLNNRYNSDGSLKNIIQVLNQYNGILIFCEPLHLAKRIRSYIILNDSVVEISDKPTTQDQIVNRKLFIDVLGDDLPGYAVSLNSKLRMSDQAATQLMKPNHIDELVDQKEYVLTLIHLISYPLMIPFGSYNKEILLQALLFCLEVQWNYYQYLIEPNGQASNVKQRQARTELKTFLDPNFLSEIICYTSSLYYLLSTYNTVYGYSVSSACDENFFGQLKYRCGTNLSILSAISETKRLLQSQMLKRSLEITSTYRNQHFKYSAIFVGLEQVTQNQLRYARSLAKILVHTLCYQEQFNIDISRNNQVSFQDVLEFIKSCGFGNFQLCSNFDEANYIEQSKSTLSSIIAERLTRIYSAKEYKSSSDNTKQKK
ncbi:EF-Hand_1 [Hexamita inflata]|uniref:Calcium-binding site n=1 Tax=Hexamita inflata TaxID=28002 RepID=A0AA86VFC9_9EUKA|nr:EF-Hand 1 [Hexamita inflata]